MAGNAFGNLFKLVTFGESHGSAIGGVIDGCPAGVELSLDLIQQELDRRRPGQSKLTTQRKESDRVEILSGVFEGKSLGTPIGFVIRNEDQKSRDYSHVKDSYRPNHGDYTWEQKFGIRDYRGGGRSSARETASRVVGGAIAKQLLLPKNIEVLAWVSAVGSVEMAPTYSFSNDQIESSMVRCPDGPTAEKMIEEIETVRKNGDSVGGVITCVVKNCPPGWGEPVFDKLHADLGKALFSINAVKGVEFGAGFASAKMRGSEMNDQFISTKDGVKTKTNNSGGIQAGISNGELIVFRVAFKPVATIFKDQTTINKDGEEVELKGKGRHDPCVVPRAVPIVEAMTSLVLADHYLLSRSNKI